MKKKFYIKSKITYIIYNFLFYYKKLKLNFNYIYYFLFFFNIIYNNI